MTPELEKEIYNILLEPTVFMSVDKEPVELLSTQKRKLIRQRIDIKPSIQLQIFVLNNGGERDDLLRFTSGCLGSFLKQKKYGYKILNDIDF